MAVYFVMNNTDWTPYIDLKTYAINRGASFTEWQDGNGRFRRDVLRQDGRITGTFQIGFSDPVKIAAWENSVSLNTSHHVQIYVNNISSLVETDVFLTITAQTRRDELNGRIWTVYQVNVEEC